MTTAASVGGHLALHPNQLLASAIMLGETFGFAASAMNSSLQFQTPNQAASNFP
jgi:hypothetical protein